MQDLRKGRSVTRATPILRSATARAAVAVLLGAVMLASGFAPSFAPRTAPGIQPAYAAGTLEDCDLDGYDDHTGAPVPWAGFDSTRGDTIPSGWDGVANSWTGQRTSSGGGSSAPGGSKGGKTPTGGSSGANGSTGGAGTQGSGAASGGTQVPVTTVAGANGAVVTTVTVVSAEVAAGSRASAPDTATVLATRGRLEVRDAQGAMVHIGSSLRITGEGFAPGLNGFEIRLDSAGLLLATVSTDANGRFEVTVEMPATVASGEHRFGVAYAGKHIAHARVAVGARPADSFVEALLVGFGEGNDERGAGLTLLLGLAVTGLVAYGWRSVMRRPRPSPAA